MWWLLWSWASGLFALSAAEQVEQADRLEATEKRLRQLEAQQQPSPSLEINGVIKNCNISEEELKIAFDRIIELRQL